MRFKIAEIHDPKDTSTLVVLETTCPLCRKAVRLVMHEDKPEIVDARIKYLEQKIKYWRDRCYAMENYGQALKESE